MDRLYKEAFNSICNGNEKAFYNQLTELLKVEVSEEMINYRKIREITYILEQLELLL